MPAIWHISAVLITVCAFFYILDMWNRPDWKLRSRLDTDRRGTTFVVVILVMIYWMLATYTLPR